MKNLWKYASSCVTVIVLGLSLFFSAIWLASKIFIPSYDDQSKEPLVETPITTAEMELIEEMELQRELKELDRFWNEHKNCDYWKGE